MDTKKVSSIISTDKISSIGGDIETVSDFDIVSIGQESIDATVTYDDISTLGDNFNKNDKNIITSIEKTYSDYYTKQKHTTPFLTKFERAKLLGVRAEMISSGNEPLVEVPKNMDSSYQIALLELKEKKIPLMIKRFLPNGKIEIWRLDELVIKD